jgi:hypothetical protein
MASTALMAVAANSFGMPRGRIMSTDPPKPRSWPYGM